MDSRECTGEAICWNFHVKEVTVHIIPLFYLLGSRILFCGQL